MPYAYLVVLNCEEAISYNYMLTEQEVLEMRKSDWEPSDDDRIQGHDWAIVNEIYVGP